MKGVGMREVFVAVVHAHAGNCMYGPQRNTYEEAEADLPALLDEVVGWYTNRPAPELAPNWADMAKYVYGEVQKRFYPNL